MHWAGVTREQYDAVKKKVDWINQPPEGGIFHVASIEKDGLHVTDVWRAAEDFQRFAEKRLNPATQELKIPGTPDVVIHPAHAVWDARNRTEL
jgi:hypothetical protein